MLSLSSDSSLCNEAKKSGFFADMNAARSVHLLTAAAKVNWTLTRFRTPLYEAGHSLRVRTACRHSHAASWQDAGLDKCVTVVKTPLRLRPRRGRSLVTPDEATDSGIWGSECIRHALRGALRTCPEARTWHTAEVRSRSRCKISCCYCGLQD